MLKRIGAWGAIVTLIGAFYGAVVHWGHHGRPNALPPHPSTPALAATDGTGVGPAQDATGQAINLKLGATPIPCGGTGVGPLQDSTMQCVLTAIGTGGGGVDAGSIILAGDTTGPANANTNVAMQGQAVSAGASNGQIWIFNGTAWVPGFVGSIIDGGTITLAGDVTGAANANRIWSISGDGGNVVPITPNDLQWVAPATAPEISQATSTTGNGVPFYWVSQGPLSAGTNSPGNEIALTPSPISTGAPGLFQTAVGTIASNTIYTSQGEISNGSAIGAYWCGAVSATTNYCMNGTGTTNSVNAGTTLNLSIGGTTQLALTSAQLAWPAAISSPTYTQTIQVANTPPTATTISAQSASLTSTTGTAANTTGASLNLAAGLGSSGNGGVWAAGNINLQLGAPSAGGTEAFVNVQRSGSTIVAIGAQVGTPANGAIYMGGVTPSATNYALSASTTATSVAGVNGLSLYVAGNQQVAISNGAFTFESAIVRFAAVVSPVIFHLPQTTDVATSAFAISAQNADQATAAIANTTGGSLNLAAGTGAINNTGGTWQSGNVNLQVNTPNPEGTEAFVNVQRAGTTLVAMGQGIAGYGTIWLGSANTPINTNWQLGSSTGANTYLNTATGGSIFLSVAAAAKVTVTTTLASFGVAVGGQGTAPLQFSGQTSPNTVACGVGGTQTVSAAQAIIPFFLVTTGTLTSNCVIDFTTNAPTGHFIVDLSGVGALGAFTLGFKSGTATQTLSATQITNLLATGANGAVIYTGTNRVTLAD